MRLSFLELAPEERRPAVCQNVLDLSARVVATRTD